jgi:chorismate synthase
MKGSQHNDPFYYEDGDVRTSTNNAGGILGGLTSGMPVVFRTAVKPTSSIGIVQNTVDLSLKKNTTIQIKGRHDPCIAPRAVPVAEAIMALAVLDCWLSSLGWDEACLPASAVGTGQKEA